MIASKEPEILLQQAEQCYWHGQFPEALALFDQLETHETVSELARLQGQLLRCRIFAYPDVKNAQALADEILPLSQALNQPLVEVGTSCVLASRLVCYIFHGPSYLALQNWCTNQWYTNQYPHEA